MHPAEYQQRNHKLIKLIIDHFGHRYFLNKTVLDLGCFNGDLANAFARIGAKITAVDARKEHIDDINKKYPHIRTIQLDLDKDWPFADFEFNIVLSLGVMCHLKDYAKHLNNICSAAEVVVLETEVLDFAHEKSEMHREDNVIPDRSFNGEINLVSGLAIQNKLSEIGATFKRIDDTKLNVRGNRYDWREHNTGKNDGLRRIWFIRRDKHIAQKVLNEQRMVLARQEADERAKRLASEEQQRKEREEKDRAEAEARSKEMPVPHIARQFPPPDVNIIPEIKSEQIMCSMQPIQTSNQSVKLYPLPDDLSTLRKNNEKLRVLYLELGEQQGMRDAFNNIGVDLQVYDYWSSWLNHKNHSRLKSEFLQKVNDLKPQLIHTQLQFTGLLKDALNEARTTSQGTIITNWSGDVRANAVSDFITIGRLVDYSLISSTGQLNMYKSAGLNNIQYWQIGLDPKINYAKNATEFKYDGVFLGNHYGGTFPDGRMRHDAVSKCKDVFGSRFGLFGNGYGSKSNGSVENRRANDIYNESICCVSISNFNNIAHYFSDRLLHCLGSGRPTISWYFPGIEDYFIEGENILIARSIQNLVDKIEWCKNNINEANRIGKNGYNLVMKNHTFTSRVLELLNITGLIGKL